jgi:hypothetical protein
MGIKALIDSGLPTDHGDGCQLDYRPTDLQAWRLASKES